MESGKVEGIGALFLFYTCGGQGDVMIGCWRMGDMTDGMRWMLRLAAATSDIVDAIAPSAGSEM